MTNCIISESSEKTLALQLFIIFFLTFRFLCQLCHKECVDVILAGSSVENLNKKPLRETFLTLEEFLSSSIIVTELNTHIVRELL